MGPMHACVGSSGIGDLGILDKVVETESGTEVLLLFLALGFEVEGSADNSPPAWLGTVF